MATCAHERSGFGSAALALNGRQARRCGAISCGHADSASEQLAPAGDHRRPGDQPPSSSSTRSTPPSSARRPRARARPGRRARPRRRSPPTWWPAVIAADLVASHELDQEPCRRVRRAGVAADLVTSRRARPEAGPSAGTGEACPCIGEIARTTRARVPGHALPGRALGRATATTTTRRRRNCPREMQGGGHELCEQLIGISVRNVRDLGGAGARIGAHARASNPVSRRAPRPASSPPRHGTRRHARALHPRRTSR